MLPRFTRRDRPPWVAVGALAALALLGVSFQLRARHPRVASFGKVERLATARLGADAEGRPGDLVLHADGTTTVTVAASPPLPGHRPLTGAIVDASPRDGDVPDPLIYLRPTFAGGPRDGAELALASQPALCDDGRAGVRTVGLLGVSFSQLLCAGSGGRYELTTTAAGGPGAAIADELNVGALPVVVDTVGALWGEEADTPFVAVAQGGTAYLLESPGMHLRRSFSRFAAEVFPSPVLVRYRGDDTAARSFTVLSGDVLTALARVPSATRAFDVTFGPGRGGRVAVVSADGRELASGVVASGEVRQVRLPPGFGAALSLSDDLGVVTDARLALDDAVARRHVVASPSRAGTLTLEYVDGAGLPVPVHVLLKGLDVRDPELVGVDAGAGKIVSAGRSVYLFEGRARLSLAPGRYRVTASHGITWSLSEQEVTIGEAGSVEVQAALRPVVDTAGWVSGDFHLHSAPSPDSVVTLDERVLCLVSEGIDVAVATDHNHVTDLSPHVHALGADDRLATAIGVEITSVNERWGHFNAYPLPTPSGVPANHVPAYYGKKPGEIFASARGHGAKILQVNHGRMQHGIGYFDLAHLEQRTGRADPVFAGNFDAFEAFNGMWLETRDRIREGALDLVGLARRGIRVAAMGNSDSHKLLYEEAGYPRTFVHTSREPRGTLIDRVVSTLLAADTTISSGPFVELTLDGAAVGSVLRRSPGTRVHAHVRVSAPAWVSVDVVEVWHDDTVVGRFPVEGPARDGVRFERDVELDVGQKDAVFLAWAEGKTPLPDVVPYPAALPIGFTGLVHVDVDGDGTAKVPARAE